jgi:hypothetical protein
VVFIHFSGKKERKKIMSRKMAITTLTYRKKKNKKPFNGNIDTDSNEPKEKVEMGRRRTMSSK